jgi:cyclohexyl-isocyanide hydratase
MAAATKAINSAEQSMQINIIVVDDMCQLDTTGAFEVLARVPGWTVDLVAASMEAVQTDRGLSIVPTQTRESARPSEILVVPGGTGIDHAMLDDAWIAYTRREAAKAKYVFSVCTGSLLLAAAGLLTGRRAGGHWQARDLLTQFNVIPSDARLTMDGKFYTSGGVSAGIDMALRLVADVAGEETARKIQLAIEYDPAPPFPGGTPLTSPPEIVQAVLDGSRQRRADRERIVAACVRRLAPLQLESHDRA